MEAQVDSLMIELQTLKNEKQRLLVEQRGEPITMARIIGAQAQISAVMDSKILATAGMIDAINGNITRAENSITRAVNAKYGAIEERLAIQQSQLDALKNSGVLTADEKTQADAITAENDRKKLAIADKKTEETNIQKLVLDYITAMAGIGKTPDVNVMEKLRNSTDLNSAMAIYSINLPKVDPNVAELQSKYPDAGINSSDTFQQAQAKLGSSRIYQDQVRPPSNNNNIPTDVISATTQAIINNPSLFDDLTPTNRGKVITELQANGYDTTNLGVKGLSDTAIKNISDTYKAVTDLAGLSVSVESNIDSIGPITGLARLNPWSTAKKLQADMDRVRQTVGKALEGGVLRKEDEEKYKKIIPTMNDTADTARYKMVQLEATMKKDVETYKALQQASGRSLDVGAKLTKTAEVISTGSTGSGNSYTITKE